MFPIFIIAMQEKLGKEKSLSLSIPTHPVIMSLGNNFFSMNNKSMKRGETMKTNTNISNVMDANADMSKYDTEVKKVLSDPQILAWILKYTTKEFNFYFSVHLYPCWQFCQPWQQILI